MERGNPLTEGNSSAMPQYVFEEKNAAFEAFLTSEGPDFESDRSCEWYLFGFKQTMSLEDAREKEKKKREGGDDNAGKKKKK